MLAAIHGNTGFPGVKSLVVHGRASSMVERYLISGVVSQHHVPLQYAYCLVLRKSIFMVWSSRDDQNVCWHSSWKFFQVSGSVSQKVCIDSLMQHRWAEQWFNSWQYCFSRCEGESDSGGAYCTGGKVSRWSQLATCAPAVCSESVYSWFDPVK